jgi:two-component system, NarL family, nitrate/nitrite response regulator NarL
MPSVSSLRPRVVVAADHQLVAEAVRAALRRLGMRADTLRYRADDGGSRSTTHARGRVDVGVLLSDLDRPERVRAARALVGAWDVPWLVLTGAAPGPAWGALYERGARMVLSQSASLQEVSGLVTELAAGRLPHEAVLRRGELVGAWRRFTRERTQLALDLGSLTDREDEVLRRLAQGLTVRRIAELDEVSETTVRSQVKAILRKLRVRSQIAAVAAYRAVRTAPAREDDDLARPVESIG